jgi:hypothetical protein
MPEVVTCYLGDADRKRNILVELRQWNKGRMIISGKITSGWRWDESAHIHEAIL